MLPIIYYAYVIYYKNTDIAKWDEQSALLRIESTRLILKRWIMRDKNQGRYEREGARIKFLYHSRKLIPIQLNRI